MDEDLFLEAVTELPVTLSAATDGSGNYATINLPVAASVPSTMVAYTAAVYNTGTELLMSRIEDGVIPANTPVLLYSASTASGSLTLTGTEPEAITSGLSGTVAAATVETATHYVLDTTADATQFARLDDTVMPGFSAYYTPGGEAAETGYTVVFATNTQILQAALEQCVVTDLDESTFDYAPGFYDKAVLDAYQEAYAAVSALDESATNKEVRDAIAILAEAYDALVDVGTVPITEGYYYIVSAGKGSGLRNGPFDDENQYALYNEDGYVKWKMWDRSDDQIYYISPNGSNWDVKNVSNNTYIDHGESTSTTWAYNCYVTTSDEPNYSQVFATTNTIGKWTFKFNGNRNLYALTSSHNGSRGGRGTSTATSDYLNIYGNTDEANNYSMNMWYLYPVDEAYVEAYNEKILAARKVIVTNFVNFANNYTVGPALGEYTWSQGTSEDWYNNLTEATSIAESETSTLEQVTAAITELSGITDDLTINLPEAGTFLRIYYYDEDTDTYTYSAAANSTNEAPWGSYYSLGSTQNEDEAGIYYYDGSSLLAYPSGYYLACPAQQFTMTFGDQTRDMVMYNVVLSSTVDEKATVTISEYSNSAYVFDVYGRYQISCADADGNYNNISLDGYGVMLEIITELPVTLNADADGSGNYATINLPVAATVPEGIDAYTAAKNDAGTALVMTKIEDGVIPAQTAVLLHSETATAGNLTVGGDATAVTSVLSGTVAATTVTPMENYVLSLIDSKMAFYPYNNETMPGFKGYLEGSAGAGSSLFSLIFPDDDLTGVDGIGTNGADNDSDAPYYDLQGRRVNHPMKGQIYIRGGKKIKY